MELRDIPGLNIFHASLISRLVCSSYLPIALMCASINRA